MEYIFQKLLKKEFTEGKVFWNLPSVLTYLFCPGLIVGLVIAFWVEFELGKT